MTYTREANGERKAARKNRTPKEQRAEIERVARQHGANLSEEAFDATLKKVARHKSSAQH